MNLYITILLLVVYLSGCGSLTPKEVSISQLIAEYQENTLEASAKYNGRTLIFTATVLHFTELDDSIHVYLEGGRVLCLIDKPFQPDIYSKLQKGEIRTFKGVVSKDVSIISLTKCEIK